MSESYCRSCYRPIAAENIVCAACERAGKPRWLLALGIAGLPLLAVGVLTLNARLCLLGAAMAAIATLVHVVLSLR